MANKINLLSHDGEHTFDLTDPKQLITGEEQEVINSEAHPLVYGDKLVEFLKLMKEYVNLHVHPYNGLPADPDSTKLEVLRFDLDTILNKNKFHDGKGYFLRMIYAKRPNQSCEKIIFEQHY